MTYISLVFTIATTRKMAHKCNYRLLTEKFITKELSFISSKNTVASFSAAGMFAFMNLEVKLRLRATVSCCSITHRGWTQEKFLLPIPLFSPINEEFFYYNGAF